MVRIIGRKRFVTKQRSRAIRFTKEGYETLKKTYDDLLGERPAAVEDLRKSRELGDLSENGFYKAARAKLSGMDGRLRRMKYQLDNSMVVDNISNEKIGIGSIVLVADDKEEARYHIVGDTEADPMQSRISLYSPIGRALVGKKVGDTVQITIPKGTKRYTIKEVSI